MARWYGAVLVDGLLLLKPPATFFFLPDLFLFYSGGVGILKYVNAAYCSGLFDFYWPEPLIRAFLFRLFVLAYFFR